MARRGLPASTPLVVSLPLVVVAALGCGSEAPVRSPASAATPIVRTTSAIAPRVAPPPPNATAATAGSIQLSNELSSACRIQFGDVDRAPKFDFDQSELLPEDREILDQVARCVTSGPLKGRALLLVGRADPRGEAEYNMVLGEHRADSVARYLESLGVPGDKIAETSRGKLDATGTDEETWRKDRRVDIALR